MLSAVMRIAVVSDGCHPSQNPRGQREGEESFTRGFVDKESNSYTATFEIQSVICARRPQSIGKS